MELHPLETNRRSSNIPQRHCLKVVRSLIHLFWKHLKVLTFMRHSPVKYVSKYFKHHPVLPTFTPLLSCQQTQHSQHSGLSGYVRNTATVPMSSMSKISLFSSLFFPRSKPLSPERLSTSFMPQLRNQ